MILNKHKSICISVSLLLALFCSCSKEKLPEPTTGRFENAPFKWDFIHLATTDDAMFIGDRNICQVDIFCKDGTDKSEQDSGNACRTF
ncbi:hypothetical protein [Bacteroides stercorirosoris]|uniref:Lipoprotein n=1 Tax=Bacteroides stercorirosoris TaxID=871324 RepID=A0A1M6FH77_9BACE|nr:hypothetical protein [Bacteroides stercorirosoris]SHI97025.1 hypothetical protein SAMN05444350_11230 [Bacteroides stercorirosoris]